MNLNFSSTFKTAKSVITANSPVLLVGTAVAGVITTGVLAFKGGYKARGIIDEAELEGGELTTSEKFQLTWLTMVSPAVAGATTIVSVVGLHKIHNKRSAAMAALYAGTVNQLDEYQERAEELLGPKKSQALNDAVAQSEIDELPFEPGDVAVLTDGTELCVDLWSGRPFLGSMPIIEKAFAELNIALAEDGHASLNDFYEWLGLDSVDMGDSLGWNKTEERVEATYGSVTTADGRPAITFRFRQKPKTLSNH